MNLQTVLYRIILPEKKVIVRYAVTIDYFTIIKGVRGGHAGRTAMERRAVATERDPPLGGALPPVRFPPRVSYIKIPRGLGCKPLGI